MAYGGKRGGAGERVLEGRHVIGLFCLMLLFSGVFFTLGYVMGKNQFDTQVRAADPSLAANPAILPKKDPGGKRGAEPGNPKAGPDATPMYPEWEFYHAGNVKKADDHLKGTESAPPWKEIGRGDRKSTRLNSSHVRISYAVFCLKKKKKNKLGTRHSHMDNGSRRLVYMSFMS